MSRITLHNEGDASATYVSNHFIDYYMTSANGEFVKIYLYLLRCMNASDCSFSLSAAADRFEHTEKDILRALKYWEKMELLRLEYDESKRISGIRLFNPKAIPAPTQNPPVAVSAAPTTSSPEEKRSYTASQLAAFQEKENVRELLFVTEHYLKRPLTSTDVNTILFWYDKLELPVDLIEYLIEYCISKGHTSLRYMDKVAISWKEEGINTVDRAKRASSAFSKLHFTVMRALGITGRNLIASETAYIDKWTKNYGFSADIIEEACRRTIAATHQPNFEYTDKILESWQKQQVHHLSDIARLDSTYQNTKKSAAVGNKAAAPNRFHNFNQRTYDYEQLEQQLLSAPRQ